MVTQEAILEALPVGPQDAISREALASKMQDPYANSYSRPLNMLRIKKLVDWRKGENPRIKYWYRREACQDH
jgi:hypothetical protein